MAPFVIGLSKGMKVSGNKECESSKAPIHQNLFQRLPNGSAMTDGFFSAEHGTAFLGIFSVKGHKTISQL